MDVIVNDNDILNIIYEFLQSRKLILCSQELVKEAKLDHDVDENLNLKAFQGFCWAGKWDYVRTFLQPFCVVLDDFPTERLKQLLFRQCFCENQAPCLAGQDKIDFQSINEDALGGLSNQETQTFLHSVQAYYNKKVETLQYPQAVLVATRMDCYNEILNITKEVFYQSKTTSENCGNERLVSMLLKGSFYDMCTAHCGERAAGTIGYKQVEMEREVEDITNFHVKTSIQSSSIETVSPSFYYWLKGIKTDDVFKQPYIEEDVQIIVENKIFEREPLLLIDDQNYEFAKSQFKHNEDVNNNSNVAEVVSSSKTAENKEVNDENINNNNNAAASGECDGVIKTGPYEGEYLHPLMTTHADDDMENTLQSITLQEGTLKSEEKMKINDIYHNMSEEPLSADGETRDSYMDFLSQKSKMKENRDQMLRKLEVKENEATRLRKVLEQKLEATNKKPPTASQSETSLRVSSSVASMRSIDSLLQSSRDKQHVNNSGNSGNSGQAPDKFMRKPRKYEHRFNYIPVEKTGDTAAIRSVSFHPSGNVYAVGTNSHALKFCKVPSNLLASLHKLDSSLKDRVGVKWSEPFLTIPKVHKGSIYSSAWNDKGDVIATCSNDKSVKLFLFDEEHLSLKTPPLVLAHHNGVVRDVAFLSQYSSANLCLASAGPSDGVIYITDCETTVPIHKINAHGDQILSLYSWKSQMLASASQDGCVRVWDLRSGKCTNALQFANKSPTSVCIDAQGSHIAVGKTDAVTQVFDMKSPNIPLHTFKVHDNEVRSVRYHPFRSSILMTSSYDHTSVVIDYQQQNDYTTSRLCHHHDKVIQSRWHPSGLMLATTSADQTCVLAVVQEKMTDY